MLQFLGIIFFELVLLYFLSERIGRTVYSIFYLIFRNQEVATGFVTFMYLPGTVVHELSHLIVAEVLRVPTGEISFTPHIEKSDSEKDEVRAGSLKIAKTDPLRRFLIGFAPVSGGLGILMLLLWLFNHFWINMTTWQMQTIFVVLIGYLLYTVSNSMFSSKKDMEGAHYLIPVVLLVIAVIYFLGIRISLTDQILTVTMQLLTGLARSLGIVVLINVGLLTLSALFLHLIAKMLKLTIKI